jgi:poly(3-hydroxybutyrate) depolymerase
LREAAARQGDEDHAALVRTLFMPAWKGSAASVAAFCARPIKCWAVADRFGFALLLPEQPRSNNPNGCFNWFQTGDIERGQDEPLSIRQMVAKMVSDLYVVRAFRTVGLAI